MLGNIIGAMVGAKAAEKSRNIDGAGGALLGAIAVPVATAIARRIGPIGWIAAAVGGYAVSRYKEGKGSPAARKSPTDPRTSTTSGPS